MVVGCCTRFLEAHYIIDFMHENAVKIFTLVWMDDIRGPKSEKSTRDKGFSNCFGFLSGKILTPFGEMVSYHKDIFNASSSFLQWANKSQSPKYN